MACRGELRFGQVWSGKPGKARLGLVRLCKVRPGTVRQVRSGEAWHVQAE